MPSISPPSERVAARLFDGATARPRAATAWIDGDALVVAADGQEGRVPLHALTRERVVLHRADLPDWRLILSAADAAVVTAVPDRHRFTRSHGRGIAAAVAATLLAGALVWSLGGRALAWAAPLVPRTIVVQAGLPLAQMLAGGDRRCRDGAGQAALDRLVRRVLPRRPVEAVLVRVGRNEGVNAFTLPGGQVVVLSGLIEAARTPDEVAGVLAHEFGHVQMRHPNQALLRHFGFDVFAQGLGGNVGSLAATGLFLRNSRAAEAEADGVALALLREGRVSPSGLADFFGRLEGDPARGARDRRFGALADLLATHPGDAARQARFRAAATQWRPSPVLTDAEWASLRRICGSGGGRATPAAAPARRAAPPAARG